MKPVGRLRAEPTAGQLIEVATCAADPDKAFQEVMELIERITERIAARTVLRPAMVEGEA